MHLAEDEARQSLVRRKPDIQERRRHRRVLWQSRVRGLTPSGEEFTANTIDMGAGGIRICLARPLAEGDQVVLYIDEIGRVEGVVTRVLRDIGYAIAFTAQPRKREKIADQLTWAVNRDRLGLAEEREGARRVSNGQVVATYGKGITIACSVVDMSIFGVALRTNGPRPMIGDRVKVSDREGVCVRYIEGGFALDFRTVLTD